MGRRGFLRPEQLSREKEKKVSSDRISHDHLGHGVFSADARRDTEQRSLK